MMCEIAWAEGERLRYVPSGRQVGKQKDSVSEPKCLCLVWLCNLTALILEDLLTSLHDHQITSGKKCSSAACMAMSLLCATL